MPTVTIEPELYQRVETAASERKTSVDEVLADAARDYLWELDRQKISQESQAYCQMHADLVECFLGKYVAVHDGTVVDHDSDMQTLYKRIRQRYGRTPVMMTLVVEEPIQVLTRKGFRLERIHQ
ncbi:MAG: hypothetical protein GY759_14175 [Chloroflexi bacterium]|nr:hypothetical protein [Chloroflexota bacterium]